MGQGTAQPPQAASTPAPSGQQGSGLSPQQTQAVAMLLGQMGKRQMIDSAMQTPTQQALSTQTIQGGSYFNPNSR